MKEQLLTVNEFLSMTREENLGSYQEMADIVIELSYESQTYRMLNWLCYIGATLQKLMENDPPSATMPQHIVFNQDTVMRCMLDTMVQRAGGIVQWDTGDAGWGQLYAISIGDKSEPCPGGKGYLMGFREYLKEVTRNEMIAKMSKPELYADDEYDGGPGCLDVGPCYIEEVPDDGCKRTS